MNIEAPTFGRTPWQVSRVGFGAWAIGGSWGDVAEADAAKEALDDLVKTGKICYYGVSVEKVEEALKAIEYPNVTSAQII